MYKDAAKQTLKAACIQLCSTDCVEDNLETIARILNNHANQNIELVLLPENATLLTNNTSLKKQAVEHEVYQQTLRFLGSLAKQHQIFLIAGSILQQDEQQPEKYYNHCPVFAPDGTICCNYNKIHLFDATLTTESWQESASISPGTSPHSFNMHTNWKVGLSICYDLRFPELYRLYSASGCNIISVPAAFTVPTGKAHWELLLRARAVENQSFVLAAGQSGLHEDGRTTYGHSMIINPWGEVLVQLEKGEGLICTELSLGQLQDLQQQMPVLTHRRL